jgi:hypothetical protein
VQLLGGFLVLLEFAPPIKLTFTISMWNHKMPIIPPLTLKDLQFILDKNQKYMYAFLTNIQFGLGSH